MSDSISFDRAADDYDRHRGGLARGKRQAEAVWQHLFTGRRTLEIGVGTGAVAHGMRALGFDVLGVDLAPKMAARALERIGPRVAVADAARLPFPDASFAQAYSVWVLHRVGEPAEVLAAIARVLEPGGVYVDIPSTPRVGADPIAEATDSMEPLHSFTWWRRAGAERVEEVALAAGLRVVGSYGGPAFTWTETPSDVVERIEARPYSWMWDLDQARWDELIEPSLERLRAMPDEPVERAARDQVLVMRKL